MSKKTKKNSKIKRIQNLMKKDLTNQQYFFLQYLSKLVRNNRVRNKNNCCLLIYKKIMIVQKILTLLMTKTNNKLKMLKSKLFLMEMMS